MKANKLILVIILSLITLTGCSESGPSASEIKKEKKAKYLYGVSHMKIENRNYGTFPRAFIANFASDSDTLMWHSSTKKWSSPFGTDSGFVTKHKDKLYAFGMTRWNAYSYNIATQKAEKVKKGISPFFVNSFSNGEVLLTSRNGLRQSDVYFGKPETLRKGISVKGIFGTGWRDETSGDLWIANHTLDTKKDHEHAKNGFVYHLSREGKKVLHSFKLPYGDFKKVTSLNKHQYLLTGEEKWYIVNTKNNTVKETKNPLNKLAVMEIFEIGSERLLIARNSEDVPDHFYMVWINKQGELVKKKRVKYPSFIDSFYLDGNDLYSINQVKGSDVYAGNIGRIDIRTGKVVAQRILLDPKQRGYFFLDIKLID